MLEAAVSSTGCSGVNGFMVPCRSGGITILTGEEHSASDVCATGAGCVPVSERICYQGCLCNRGHGVVSSSGNTNLQDDL